MSFAKIIDKQNKEYNKQACLVIEFLNDVLKSGYDVYEKIEIIENVLPTIQDNILHYDATTLDYIVGSPYDKNKERQLKIVIEKYIKEKKPNCDAYLKNKEKNYRIKDSKKYKEFKSRNLKTKSRTGSPKKQNFQ